MHRKPTETTKQSETRRLVWLFIGIAIAFPAVGYLVGNIRLIYVEQETRLFAQQRDSLHQRMAQQEYRSNILQVELDVERAATQALQHQLRLTQEESATIRRELTFYQRVMAPELNADGITIDSMAVNALPGDSSYYFRLILLQQERIEQLAQGSLRLTLRGLRDGERQEYSLLALAGIDEGSTQFVMSYFSLTEGSFTLPDNFVPETLHVHVCSRQGRQTERTYQWQQLLTAEPEQQSQNAN